MKDGKEKLEEATLQLQRQATTKLARGTVTAAHAATEKIGQVLTATLAQVPEYEFPIATGGPLINSWEIEEDPLAEHLREMNAIGRGNRCRSIHRI